MDNHSPETVRTAAYLAARERLDLKGKLKCNPPNRACGDRCIPPSWKCRVKGEGTDSHSRVVAGDPLAGAAAIARGRERLAKGFRTGNLVDIQAGRAAIARGVVKSVPGQNLKQKQVLRKRVEGAIIPIATGLFAGWALRQGHEAAKVLFPVYAKGPGRNIENAAGSAIGFVFDRIPIYGSYRQAQRENASLQAQLLARASRISLEQDPKLNSSNTKTFVELSRQKVRGLRDALTKGLKVRDKPEDTPVSYQRFRANVLGEVFGAKAEGSSVYAEPAAINLMARQYGIKPDTIIGADNTARKTFLISRVAGKLTEAADSMRGDMAVRGLNYRKPEDVDRYTEIAAQNAAKRFRSLTEEQQQEAFSSLKGTIRELVSPSKSPQPTRAIASKLFDESVKDYNEYFAQTAQRLKEDTDPRLRVHVASASDSPVKTALIGVAERLKSRVQITAPIAGANHAELVLQRVYNEYAVTNGFNSKRKATWLASDADIRYAAQDLGWDGQGGVSAAYGVLERSGQFPNLARRPSDVRPAQTKPKPSGGAPRSAGRRRMSTADRIAAYVKAGYSEEAARRKAAKDESRLKRDEADLLPARVKAYLDLKQHWNTLSATT